MTQCNKWKQWLTRRVSTHSAAAAVLCSIVQIMEEIAIFRTEMRHASCVDGGLDMTLRYVCVTQCEKYNNCCQAMCLYRLRGQGIASTVGSGAGGHTSCEPRVCPRLLPSSSWCSFMCSTRSEQQPTVSAASDSSFSFPALSANYKIHTETRDM